MKAPRRSVDAYLRSAKDFARLAAHADRLAELQRIYVGIAPPFLAEASQVANYRSGKLHIHAANGATAAKLKQLAPTLCGGFRASGAEVTELLVRVQAPQPAPPARRDRRAAALSPVAAGEIEALAGRLPEASPLRRALQRLLDQSGHRAEDPFEKHQ
jgi:hypothetical protein